MTEPGNVAFRLESVSGQIFQIAVDERAVDRAADGQARDDSRARVGRGDLPVCYDTRVTTPLIASSEPIVPARRRFLARLGIGSATLGALVASALPARAQSPSAPRRHPVDDWMDALPTAHRMLFDAVSPDGLDDIRHYASNVFAANRSGYGLESRDVGVLVILRHSATPYAYNDAMWAKYGSVFATELKILDPKTQKAPAANPANAGGETLDALSDQGAHFGVCAMATRRFAGLVARSNGSTADAVVDELGKNLVRNAHLTPAGIVAVGRAQERGYAFGFAG